MFLLTILLFDCVLIQSSESHLGKTQLEDDYAVIDTYKQSHVNSMVCFKNTVVKSDSESLFQ